jgi:hypothetical protein
MSVQRSIVKKTCLKKWSKWSTTPELLTLEGQTFLVILSQFHGGSNRHNEDPKKQVGCPQKWSNTIFSWIFNEKK